MHGVLEEDSDFMQLDVEHIREEDPLSSSLLGFSSSGIHRDTCTTKSSPQGTRSLLLLSFSWRDVKFPGDDVSSSD